MTKPTQHQFSSPDNRPSTPGRSKGSMFGRKNIIFFSFLIVCVLLLVRQPENAVSSSSSSSSSRTTKVSVPNSPQQQKGRIQQISILGERNSGTRWTFDHLSECFNHSIPVKRTLTRYKHWFQYNNPSKYPHDTLVVAQFRNPYDWLKAMEHVPHHSPAHLRTALTANTDMRSSGNDWQIFLTKPWTTNRTGEDLKLFGNETCQEDFPYQDIVSCVVEPLPHEYYNHTIRYSEHQPFYEMIPGTGKPFPNIMEMRTAKIENFLSVVNYEGVADLWVVQYEYLLAKGTQSLLDRIQAATGIQPNCKAKEKQVRARKSSRIIEPEFAKFIREHLNWQVEGLVGYKPELHHEQDRTEW